MFDTTAKQPLIQRPPLAIRCLIFSSKRRWLGLFLPPGYAEYAQRVRYRLPPGIRQSLIGGD